MGEIFYYYYIYLFNFTKVDTQPNDPTPELVNPPSSVMLSNLIFPLNSGGKLINRIDVVLVGVLALSGGSITNYGSIEVEDTVTTSTNVSFLFFLRASPDFM